MHYLVSFLGQPSRAWVAIVEFGSWAELRLLLLATHSFELESHADRLDRHTALTSASTPLNQQHLQSLRNLQARTGRFESKLV